MDPKDTKLDPLRTAYERALTANPGAVAPEIVRAYHQRELSNSVDRTLREVTGSVAMALSATAGATAAGAAAASQTVLVEAEAASRRTIQVAEESAQRVVTHTIREVRQAALIVLVVGAVFQTAFWLLVAASQP